VAGVEHRGGQASDGFSRMQRAGVVDERPQVDGGGTAVLHAVGEQDQAVPGSQLEFLESVGARCHHAEGQVDRQFDLFDGAVAQPHRPGMACVDQFTEPGFEVHAQQLPGGQTPAVAQQGLVGVVGLCQGVTAAAACASQCADQQGGQQCRVGVVAHGVGDGQVQGVAVEGVVVGVAADVVGRDQPAREGELGGLAARRRGKQLVLDLRGQAGLGGAPAQMVEVGETPVRDDDVGQRVGRVADLPEHGVVGGLQGQLQQADAVAPVGDRCDDAPSALAVGFHVLALALQHAVVDAVLKGDRIVEVGGFPSCRGEPYQALADEVDEQEGHPLRTEPLAQIA